MWKAFRPYANRPNTATKVIHYLFGLIFFKSSWSVVTFFIVLQRYQTNKRNYLQWRLYILQTPPHDWCDWSATHQRQKFSPSRSWFFLHIKVLLLFSGSLDFTCEAYNFTLMYCNNLPIIIKQIVNNIFYHFYVFFTFFHIY